jgi:hypothetical protein
MTYSDHASSALSWVFEPPHDLRRLICRREWSYEQIQSIFP